VRTRGHGNTPEEAWAEKDELFTALNVALGGLYVLRALASLPEATDKPLGEMFDAWGHSATQNLRHNSGFGPQDVLPCGEHVAAIAMDTWRDWPWQPRCLLAGEVSRGYCRIETGSEMEFTASSADFRRLPVTAVEMDDVPGGCSIYAHPLPVKELAERNRRMATTVVTIALGKHGLWPPAVGPVRRIEQRAPAGPRRAYPCARMHREENEQWVKRRRCPRAWTAVSGYTSTGRCLWSMMPFGRKPVIARRSSRAFPVWKRGWGEGLLWPTSRKPL
jgi:hypothetical protein